MTWDNTDFVRRLATAVGEYDRTEANALVDELIGRLRSTDDPYPLDDAGRVLDLLRRKQYFGEMERAGDGFITAGRTAPEVRRRYAQALLDQGKIAPAGAILESVVADTETGSKENTEARGLLGRAAKQSFVDGGTAATERSRNQIRSAIDHYSGVYRDDPERLWHGINTVALVMRARADGIDVPDAPDPENLAAEILGTIELRRQSQEATFWDYATAIEACVALGRTDDALEWAATYVQSPNADAFEYASTLRQFEEVWRLDPDTDPGRGLLPVLRAAVLSHEGGRVDLDADKTGLDTVAGLTGGGTFESVLGAETFEGVRWLQAALERSQSIALVSDTTGRPLGTAFVVGAADCGIVAPEDELLLLTNSHVISLDEGAVLPADARIRFESRPDVSYQVKGDIVWNSPIVELDATLVRTDPPLTEHTPMPIAGSLPEIESRVYIIGHPSGRPLSFSIYDNQLLNAPAPLLHYRTPTEGGSSGSPVFNRQWQLVGLHHAGNLSVTVPGRDGFHASNEGIMFTAIRTKASEDTTTG